MPFSNPPQTPPFAVDKKSLFAPITTVLRSSSSTSSLDQQDSVAKPVVSKRAKKRFAIDESDSEDDRTPTPGQHRSVSRDHNLDDVEPQHHPPAPTSPSQPLYREQQTHDVAATPLSADANPALSPSSLEAESHRGDSDESTSTTKVSPSLEVATPSTSRSTPTWSDASLRSYMDNDQGIKDMLIIVHDNSNVNPVGPEHPLVDNLFVNERTRLAEMQLSLDSMLMGWMAKKNSTLLSR